MLKKINETANIKFWYFPHFLEKPSKLFISILFSMQRKNSKIYILVYLVKIVPGSCKNFYVWNYTYGKFDKNQ